MRPACSLKKAVLFLAAMILTVTVTGCRKDSVSSITKGEWIALMTEKAGMLSHTEDQPYYLNINERSEHFNAVQAAVEWKILDPAYPFEPDEVLTREWTAFTLMNLMRDIPEGNTSAIKDISKTMFTKQVASAVSCGLLTTDHRGMFQPKKTMDRDEALKCLDQAVSYINHKELGTPTMEIVWDGEPRDLIETEPVSFDEETGTAVFPDDVPLKEGDLVYWSEGMDDHMMLVEEVDGNEVKMRDFDILEEAESFRMKGSQELNFEEAEFWVGGEKLPDGNETGSISDPYFSFMAKESSKMTFEINGYDVTLTKAPSSCTFDIAKKKGDHTKVYSTIKLSGVKLDMDLNFLFHRAEKEYLNLSYTTSQTYGVKTDYKNKLVGDFAKIDKDNFFSSLGSFMTTQDAAEKTTLPLAEIKIPVLGIPTACVTLQVNLQISTSGKAEIVLTQEHSLGFETVDGAKRCYNDCDKKADCMVKADTAVTAGLTVGVKGLGMTLADAGIKAGADVAVKTTVHMYDDAGQKQSTAIDSPADLADELAAIADDVMVCADASGHWIFDIELNSKDSVLGKIGFNWNLELLDDNNAPIFPAGNAHYENWQQVPSCTRKNRKKKEERETIEAKDKIAIENYAMAVKPGETKSISIVGLPEGISVSDLRISSSDPSVASVSGLTVTGHSPGSAIITIATPDNETFIYCNIMVPSVSS